MARKVKCPKCRSTRPESYTEMWTDHGISFDAMDGVPSEEGWMQEGNPSYVVAHCGCGHIWRLKGISQITELRAAARNKGG